MPAFDLRAVILLAGVMGALMSVVIYSLRRSYPRSIGGLGYWAAGPAVAFLSSLLFGTRSILPELFTVVIANLLLMTGVVLLYLGSRGFYRVEVVVRPWVIAIVCVTVVLAWFTFVQPNYNWRLLTVSSFMVVVFVRHTILVIRLGGAAFSARYVQVVLIVEALVLSLRAISALSGDVADMLQASPIQNVYIASYAVAMLMLSVGLVLMATDRLRAELEHLATHDSLTGALNRRALIEAAALELARCRRNYKVMALLVMDLDHFKAINDTHGHQAGDRVLVDFATRVKNLLRQPDRFGRFGGEEFVVLLPETSLDEARGVAERIRTEVESGNKDLPPCTVSIGVAVSGADDLEVDAIVARADAAMYRAKQGGRNRVEASLP